MAGVENSSFVEIYEQAELKASWLHSFSAFHDYVQIRGIPDRRQFAALAPSATYWQAFV